ncbi:MAG: dUTP diphosphatase [Erysipelotrichales bacterium]|nr:dUTP diphosphatase [Erysipelotrichales bacterium]
MSKVRGFEIAKGWEDKDIHLPKRSTKNSAGYDVEAAEDVVIPPFKPGVKPTLIPTGLKAYCQPDEWYMLANRSSGPKKGFIMANSIGIIDSDYYENETNDGHFYFQYINCLDHDIEVKKGDVIGQVIFQKYLIVDDDDSTGVRTGGFGSTDK